MYSTRLKEPFKKLEELRGALAEQAEKIKALEAGLSGAGVGGGAGVMMTTAAAAAPGSYVMVQPAAPVSL